MPLRLVLSLLFLSGVIQFESFSQSETKKLKSLTLGEFVASEKDPYGFSSPEKDPKISFDTLSDQKGNKVLTSFKLLPIGTVGYINFKVAPNAIKRASYIRFLQSGSRKYLRGYLLGDSIISVTLPKTDSSYIVYTFFENRLISALKVRAVNEINEKVIVVPMVTNGLNLGSLETSLNAIFRQALMKIDIFIKPLFQLSGKDQPLRMTNPLTNDQYTDQMRKIRDTYFSRFPDADKHAFYLFVTPDFLNNSTEGFCVKSKSIAFIPLDTGALFNRNCARIIAQSIGSLKIRNDRSENLMAVGMGLLLDHEQWNEMRHNPHTYAIYDNYEDLKTNNGSVAYYFWREDAAGNIVLDSDVFLNNIKRPFKKNYTSYHLDINEFMYSPRMTLWGTKFCFWHFVSLVFVWPVLWFLRGRVLLKIYRKLRKPSFWRITSGWIVLLFTILINILAFEWIEVGYRRFEVRTGVMKDLGVMNTNQAIETILHNENIKNRSEPKLKSEIIIRRNNFWYLKKRAQVLYFDLFVDRNQRPVKAKFASDSDSLIINQINYSIKARSHYVVVNYRDEKKRLLFQRLYNHSGSDLGAKLTTKDPVQRILLFVNGYRPTSIGHSFEENFEDLQRNGLEYPNSNNIIYDFDRYDYWNPWNAMDSMFVQRINPSKKYYADGHFSVATSNHESLVKFTALAAVYPKRCKDRMRHTCYQTVVTSTGWFGSKNKNTKDLLRLSSNYSGFRERYQNGCIAGRSMLQELNEIPNRSDNDTLYIVAHSMGYAYALGMINELRGKIAFGGFYILAPENASCGKVIPGEWKEVWQYGCNFNRGREDAPCLQDGVAPQTAVSGLSDRFRCYFPADLYEQKGFYSSHFVGYYSWIFDIKKGSKGFIGQR
jgi:hypothetical protein